jgi:hypothetical protein
MVRTACVLAGLLALIPVTPPDVDAVAFARAFRDGQADQYRMKQISGTGVSFHGAIDERVADGSTRRSLVITLGAASGEAPLSPIKTWNEFVEAERARSTLVVALSGPDLPAMSPEPATVRFSGVYDGQVRTIMRVPQASSSATDSGPCPGERPVPPDANASFYCAPLLTGATATIVPR